MSATKVIITHETSTPRALPIISISNELLNRLHLPSDLPLMLRFTGQRVYVSCQAHQKQDNLVIMPQDVATKLHIPDQSRLHLSYDAVKKEINLGPVLAILVSQVSTQKPPFADLNQFSEELIQVARKKHIFAYVVSLAEIAKGGHSVYGWTYTNKGWKRKQMPIPQVLYNRISSRKLEKSTLFKEFVKSLPNRSIHLFNHSFLNKWEVYELLSKEPRLIPYLPKTKLFQGLSSLKTMLKAYPILFIKPIHGAMGRGIFRLSRSWMGYDLQYSALDGQKYKHFSNLTSLYTFLRKKLRKQPSIIQEGIPIIHLQERAVDFRILMQKNKTGNWAVTSSVARIGPNNRFVSNIARGGEINRISTTLKKCGITDPDLITKKMASIAKLTCEAIDRHHPGHFAELGVDLAVTRSGKVYLLEINSKPSKADNTLTLPSQKGRPSVHRLLEYTLFLTTHRKVEV